MKYWKKYLVNDNNINKLAKYDTTARNKLYYLLCNAGVVIPGMYCVVTESPEYISDCKQFEKLVDAQQYRFLLTLKQIKSSIVSKRIATKEYDQFLEVKRFIEKIAEYNDKIQKNVETINDIHKDIKQTFDICSKQFGTKHAQEQSYRIYQLLDEIRLFEECKQYNENLLNGGLMFMPNKDNKLLAGIKL